MNAKILRAMQILSCAGALMSGPLWAKEVSAVMPAGNVEFVDFVVTYRSDQGCTQQRLYAHVKFENIGMRKISFRGNFVDKRIVMILGAEAKIEFFRPGDREWQPVAGAGGGGSDSQLTVLGNETKDAFFDWPLDFLVNFPAETRFRITLVDTDERSFQSQPFVLHDGKRLLREEFLSFKKQE